MPFSDFTVQTTNANAVIHEFFGPPRLGSFAGVPQDVPHLATPLVDTGSLQMQFLTTNLWGHLYHTDVGLRIGANGAITTQWYAATADVVELYAFGQYCYASQADLLTAGNVYLFGCASILAGALHPYSLFLAKSSAGLGAFPATMTLLDVEDNQWSRLSTFVTRFLWIQTPTSVILEGYKGPSDTALTKLVSYEDMSPLTSPIVDGLWGGQTTHTALKVFADETAFFTGML